MAMQNDLNLRPGDRYLCRNTGYAQLAQIVKRLSGQSLRPVGADRPPVHLLADIASDGLGERFRGALIVRASGRERSIV
jgi:hypothetical protein